MKARVEAVLDVIEVDALKGNAGAQTRFVSASALWLKLADAEAGAHQGSLL